MPLLCVAIVACSSSSSDPVRSVQTTRDDKGAWTITGTEGATLFNIFEAMGYAVATDRLWQMELFRRTARGRLAEVLGGDQLETDMLMRTTGYSDVELQSGFMALDGESREVIEGYISGVNKRIAEIRADLSLLPFEFVAVGQKTARSFIPDEWTPEDVLAWSALMQRNFDPEATSQHQIENMALMGALSAGFPQDYPAMFNDLRWTSDPDAQTYYSPSQTLLAHGTLKPAAPPAGDLRKAAETISSRFARMRAGLERINARVRMGSYAWAISGTKTRSGNPMLYSGPQMGFSVPAICYEGTIRAGGLNVSGMGIPGLPGVVIGRTPHHAWSMQVGHAHTTDYYIEQPGDVFLHRTETIHVVGGEDVILPVYHTAHGPVINPMPFDPDTYVPDPENPVISWKYAHLGYELDTVGGFLDLARAGDMDAFGAGIDRIGVSQHFCYVDRDGNIAYWMSGRDPVRPAGEYRLPQGFLPGVPVGEWDAAAIRTRPSDRNAEKGYYAGWNNKALPGYESGFNTTSYHFGPFHRAHVLKDYLSAADNLTFEQVRDLALNIATTSDFSNVGSGGRGGNPWTVVGPDFVAAVTSAGADDTRQGALDLMAAWDGHFVAGGQAQWAAGTDRADAWVLMDRWIRQTMRLTFADELGALYDQEDPRILLNALIHGLPVVETALENQYDWFQNLSDPTAPQSAEAIIVAALDTVLAELGSRPWGTGERGEITFAHDLIGPLHTMPYANRSTYAHCVEFGPDGPVRIESMFPLGQSGDIRMNPDGTPAFNPNFFSMAPVYDTFAHRPYPLFE